MKRNKKLLIALALSCCMVFNVACGSSGSTTTDTVSEPAASTPASEASSTESGGGTPVRR